MKESSIFSNDSDFMKRGNIWLPLFAYLNKRRKMVDFVKVLCKRHFMKGKGAEIRLS